MAGKVILDMGEGVQLHVPSNLALTFGNPNKYGHRFAALGYVNKSGFDCKVLFRKGGKRGQGTAIMKGGTVDLSNLTADQVAILQSILTNA
jgi:hypothetical protein